MNLDRLTCIDLDQPSQPGFRKFISAWLYRGKEFTFLVDPGPLSTISYLVSELRRLGVGRLDYILLSHIHIDHAGGTGSLLESYPEAQVICHPEGISHMIAPEKLWQGSKKVLGSLAEVFGPIIPVPAANICFVEKLTEIGVTSHFTPGHAQHHLCYQLDDLLFGGEVCGVHSLVANGIYMRPATPPRFLLDVAVNSIERMIALAPRYLIIAHYGLVEPAINYLEIGRRQLPLWVQGAAETAGLEGIVREQAFFDWLQARDANYANFPQLPEDIRARERVFLANTLRGMSEYVESRTADEGLPKVCVERS
jgi:glyoxylase-like metal-dependent hydrolase (beta-lactamase superfamily II)